jgi:hypothetical protein
MSTTGKTPRDTKPGRAEDMRNPGLSLGLQLVTAHRNTCGMRESNPVAFETDQL